MTRHVVQLMLAVGLLTAAGLSWAAANRTRQEATATSEELTLQQASDYWSGNYDAVISAASEDPNALLSTANATFRKAQRASATAPGVEPFDRALQAYASVLRNARSAAERHNAAYNFEYVARLRDAIAKQPRRAAKPAPPPSVTSPDDLPSGPTIHGRPGMHPPGTRGEEFEVLTPMDYGEREAQPEPTPGRRLPRKG